MARFTKTFFVFVDGLGLGSKDPERNPIYSGGCPVLTHLIKNHAMAIDAALDVEGIPQSATGQTALFTGINAPQVIGRHQEGFPGPVLCKMIREHNLFKQLDHLGCRCTFSNAYFIDDISEVKGRRHLSVTSTMTLAALGKVRDKKSMLAGEAICQDLTREALRARGYEGPLTTPREAAQHALTIINNNEFTLFEYFQTDRMGHGKDRQAAERVLALMDRFLEGLVPHLDHPGYRFILTSDHGNIEDITLATHTLNPVPFVVLGEDADWLKERVKRIDQVTPALVELYAREQEK